MVLYHTEDTAFKFKEKTLVRRWLNEVSSIEKRRIGDISVIFCSDPYILDINRRYLGHDYYTDIITFDYCQDDVLSGDLFISVDTVRDNAVEYSEGFSRELHRVIVHGLLHLIGYDDQSEDQQKEMREKENFYLSLLD